jgi:hypothetical protein
VCLARRFSVSRCRRGRGRGTAGSPLLTTSLPPRVCFARAAVLEDPQGCRLFLRESRHRCGQVGARTSRRVCSAPVRARGGASARPQLAETAGQLAPRLPSMRGGQAGGRTAPLELTGDLAPGRTGLGRRRTKSGALTACPASAWSGSSNASSCSRPSSAGERREMRPCAQRRGLC